MAADGMTASVDVVRGPAMDRPALEATLQRAGVVFGVEPVALQELAAALSDPDFTVAKYLIARGQMPRVGLDGYFSPAFEAGIQPGHVDSDGMMDFRERELLKPIQAGQSVGTLHLACASVAGKRVDGTELPVSPRKEATLVLADGVALDHERNVRASRTGVLLYNPGKSIAIVQQHSHRGDVDMRSGHLTMEGSLQVSGDVQRLFRVHASGDVEIAGMVAGGSVFAGGSIRVRGMIRGAAEGELEAQGEVRAKSAEAARILSHGLLKLDSAVHCQLAAEVIEVGVLRGGESEAERAIIAEELGFAQGTETRVHVAVPLEAPNDRVLRALACAKEQRSTQHRGGRAGPDRPHGGKLGRPSVGTQRDSLARTLKLRERQEQLLETASISVQGNVHPGVTIRVGAAQLVISERIAQVRFSFDHERRQVRSERFVP